MRRRFRWIWPDGEKFTAVWCNADQIAMLRASLCDARADLNTHNLRVIMDVTQWGFASHKWIVIHECDYCHQRWAVGGRVFYSPEEGPSE